MASHQVENESTEVSISTQGLIKLDERPHLSSYLKRLWKLRHFAYYQGVLKSFSGAKGTLLGKTWLLLDPFLRVAVYFVIFSVVLRVSRGMENFLAFLAVGVLVFGPLSASLTNGATFYSRNKALIRGFSFPKIALFASDSIRDFRDAMPEVAALLLFVIVVPPHVYPSIYWALIIPVIFFRQLMSVGISMITAVLSIFVPDSKNLWPIVIRFWFYSSGVVFPIAHFVPSGPMLVILELNPGAVLLAVARDLIIAHSMPPAHLWLQLVGWSVFLVCVGSILVWYNDRRFQKMI